MQSERVGRISGWPAPLVRDRQRLGACSSSVEVGSAPSVLAHVVLEFTDLETARQTDPSAGPVQKVIDTVGADQVRTLSTPSSAVRTSREQDRDRRSVRRRLDGARGVMCGAHPRRHRVQAVERAGGRTAARATPDRVQESSAALLIGPLAWIVKVPTGVPLQALTAWTLTV